MPHSARRLSSRASRCDSKLIALKKAHISSLAEPCDDSDNRQTHEQQIKNLLFFVTRKPNGSHPKIDRSMQKVHEVARLTERYNNGVHPQIPTDVHDYCKKCD